MVALLALFPPMSEPELESALRDVESALRTFDSSKQPLTRPEVVMHNALSMVRNDLRSQILKARSVGESGKN